MEEDGGERKRMIKLRCPSAPVTNKIVELVAGDDQRLDLGFISRAFGLEPNSLKLNGHFVSRGLDLVACSVTWRSLLSFFSAKGFSTGGSDSDAIIVDGKPSKLGPKRKQDSHNPGNASLSSKQYGVRDSGENPDLTDANSVCNKRLKDFSQGLLNKIAQTGSNCLNLKRKFLSADPDQSKKTRTNGAIAGSPENKVDLSRRVFLNGQFSCSVLGENGKRMREDDLVVAAPVKRRLI